MNKITTTLFAILLYSCSPKMGSKLISQQEALKNNEKVLILNKLDDQKIEGIKIGSVYSKDSSFSTNYSYYEIIEPLKEICRSKGANLLKITKFKNPDSWSTCARIKADIYHVEDIEKYQKEVLWVKKQKTKMD